MQPHAVYLLTALSPRHGVFDTNPTWEVSTNRRPNARFQECVLLKWPEENMGHLCLAVGVMWNGELRITDRSPPGLARIG